MASDLMGEPSWGAFEEERLMLAVAYGNAGGAQDIAQRARDGLMARVPQSQGAAGIREREANLAQAAIEDQETDDTLPPPTTRKRRR